MKKIKPLNWYSVVNEEGEKLGIVALKATVPGLNLNYYLTNYVDREITPKNLKDFYLDGHTGCNGPALKVTGVEDGKRLAQEHYENYIMQTFFE